MFENLQRNWRLLAASVAVGMPVSLNSVIRGHHVYQTIWHSTYVGKMLKCRHAHGNIRDLYAVASVKHDSIVRHVPRYISTPCHFFLRKDGLISFIVTGTRQYSADLRQGGVEVPS